MAAIFIKQETPAYKKGQQLRALTQIVSVDDGAPTPSVAVDSSGNVGLGTTSPNEKLELSAASPAIRLQATAAGSYGLLQSVNPSVLRVQQYQSAGNTFVDIDPMPSNGTSAGQIRMFRSTNTTGNVFLELFEGDGTATSVHRLRNSGNASYLCAGGSKLGIGHNSTPVSQCDIQQNSTTAAIPTLRLRQQDDSEEFIDFIATSGAGKPIDLTASIGTYVGRIRVAVNTNKYWMPLYS